MRVPALQQQAGTDFNSPFAQTTAKVCPLLWLKTHGTAYAHPTRLLSVAFPEHLLEVSYGERQCPPCCNVVWDRQSFCDHLFSHVHVSSCVMSVAGAHDSEMMHDDSSKPHQQKQLHSTLAHISHAHIYALLHAGTGPGSVHKR